MVSTPTATMPVPRGLTGRQAEHDDEQRHEQEASAVGEQTGEEADAERRVEDEGGLVASCCGFDGVVDGVRHQHSGTDDEQHHTREHQEARAAQGRRCERAEHRARYSTRDRQDCDSSVELSGA